MALQKQSVPVNFAKGLDQKTDPKQVRVDRFLSMENRVFNKLGLLSKRFGFSPYGQTVASPVGSFTFSQIPGSVSVGRNVSDYQDELTLNDGLNLYSLSTTANNWVYKGRVELCQTEEQSIYKNQMNNLMPDSALNSTLGINVFAWESWTASPYQISASAPLSAVLNGVQISAIDATSGQTIFNSYLANTTSRPRCVSIGSNLYVLYISSVNNHLYAQPVTQTGFGVAVDLISDIDATTPNYDVIVNSSLIYIAYNGTGSTVKVASFNAALSAQATASKAETAGNGIGIFPDTSNNVWIAYNNGTETKAFIMNSALAVTVLAPTVVDNSSNAAQVKNVTGVYDGTRGIIYYDKPGASLGGPSLGPATGDGTENYTVTASFVQPAVGSTVVPTISGPGADFEDFFSNNSIVYIPTGGYYFITGAVVGSSATLANLGLPGNAAPGATVASTTQSIFTTAGYQNSYITYNTLTAAGVAGTATTLMRSVYLAGKAHLVNSVPHVIIGHDSPLQSTYFSCALYNLNSLIAIPKGVVVAKVGASGGGGVPYRSVLPAVNVVSTGIVQFAFPQRSVDILRTSNNSSQVVYFLGVASAAIDFTTNNVQTMDLGRNLIIGTGLPQMYDGAVAVEQGFNVYPETFTAVGSGNDGDLSTGLYGYKIVYEWIDNIGQTHRSAPSPNLSFNVAVAPAAFTGNTTNSSAVITTVSTTVGLQIGMAVSGSGIPAGAYIISIDSTSQITISAAATATAAGVTITPGSIKVVTLTLPTLRITEKQNVTIAVYRTVANQTIYYRIDTQYLTYPIENSISTDSITFVDVIGDYSIVGNEQLYTGQEVENIAPPPALALAEFRNRAILIPSDNRYAYDYSKQVVAGSPVEFSDLFRQNVSTTGGPLIGAGVIDDKLILFQKGQISYVTGTGPSPSGANNDFSDPQFITADASLFDPMSLVQTPVGLMFKSEKGIYLLDRSLQTKYIGKDVEDYNQYTVTGAVLTPTGNQVRFTLSNGVVLVYNYYWTGEDGIGQWGIFTGISAVSDCLHNGTHAFVTTAGLVSREVPAVYTDGATGINTKFSTAWVNLAGMQGFERAYYFYLLATYISAHTLTINIYYDYDDTVAQTLSITPAAGELEQWRIFLDRQKCEAFRIEVQEVGSSGAGLTISGLNLVVGLKKGYTTIRAANSAS